MSQTGHGFYSFVNQSQEKGEWLDITEILFKGWGIPWTPVNGSRHTNQPTEIVEESKLTKSVLKRSKQVRRPTKFYQPSINYMNIGEHISYQEVMAPLDVDTWLQAMKSKMNSINENNTCELVELPTWRKPLLCEWVFRYKYVSDSEKPKFESSTHCQRFEIGTRGQLARDLLVGSQNCHRSALRGRGDGRPGAQTIGHKDGSPLRQSQRRHLTYLNRRASRR